MEINDDGSVNMGTTYGTAYNIHPGSGSLVGRWVLNVQQWDEDSRSYQYGLRHGDYPSRDAAIAAASRCGAR